MAPPQTHTRRVSEIFGSTATRSGQQTLMTTPQTDPVRRNEAEQAPPNEAEQAPNESIDRSMAEADRANGEGDPDDASRIQCSGERNDEPYGEEDKPKAMRRAD